MSILPADDGSDLTRHLREYLASRPDLSAVTITAASDMLTREWITLMDKLTAWHDQVTFGDPGLGDLLQTDFNSDQPRGVTTVRVLYAPELIGREEVLTFVHTTLDDIFAARGLGARIVLLLGRILTAWPSKTPEIGAIDI